MNSGFVTIRASTRPGHRTAGTVHSEARSARTACREHSGNSRCLRGASWGGRVPAATGGYLRILPWTVTRRAIDQNVATDVPVVVNVHPWELDPEQPRRQVPLWNRTLHYTGLGTTKVKLERLLQTYRFTSLAELHARYAAEAVSRVQSARRREVLRSAAKGLASGTNR